LDQRDFRLFENHVPQEIAVFSADGAEPLSLAFLLDVSDSMRERDKLEQAKAVVRTLVERLRPADRFALMRFSEGGVAWVSDFTQDRSRFWHDLEALETSGRTALVDALAVTPHLVQDRIASRRALVLITDATDNFSRTPVVEAVELARRVNVPLFTIAMLGVPAEWLPREGVHARLEIVERVSAVTGGRALAVHDAEDCQAAADALHDELTAQYFIGYYPASPGRSGSFKEIRLEVADSRLRARTRSGYYPR
jgi:VWFA-related protein